VRWFLCVCDLKAGQGAAMTAISRGTGRDQAAEATVGFDGMSDGGCSPESRAWKQAVS
jgi:hypothetical protein